MNVLVTGSDGYIGVLLVSVLRQRGHHVTGLDTGFYRAGWLYDDAATQRAADIGKDVRRITSGDLQGFDAVVHLAELSNDPLGQHTPALTYGINHRGSVRLAQLCREAGIPRFVYTSSCSVYGVGADGFRTEKSETNPQTAYACCKVLTERDVSALANGDFSPTFLRNATAFGPSPRMRFDLVLNNLAGLAWTTRQIRLTSDGTPWRPLVHVSDICDAVACVLEAPREVVHDQIFNVGDTRQNYRVREIAGIVSATFPGCALTVGTSDGDNRSYRVSFDKIHERLPEFRCRRDAATGARQLLDLFTRIGLTPETFRAPSYTRLQQLEHLLATGQIDADFYWRQP